MISTCYKELRTIGATTMLVGGMTGNICCAREKESLYQDAAATAHIFDLIIKIGLEVFSER